MGMWPSPSPFVSGLTPPTIQPAVFKPKASPSFYLDGMVIRGVGEQAERDSRAKGLPNYPLAPV